RSNTLKPLCLLATRPDSSRDSASGFSLPNEIKSTNAKPVKYMKPQNMSSISNHTSKKPIVSSIFRSHISHNARNRRIYGGGFFVPSFSAQKNRRSKFRMVTIVIGTNVMYLEPPPDFLTTKTS